MDEWNRKSASIAQIAAKREARQAAAEAFKHAPVPAKEDKDEEQDAGFEDLEDSISDSSGGSPERKPYPGLDVDELTRSVARMSVFPSASNVSPELLRASRATLPPASHACPKLMAANHLSLPSSDDEDATGGKDAGTNNGEDLEDSDCEIPDPYPGEKFAPLLQPASDESKECPDLVLGDKGEYRLVGRIASKLYPHQVDGVKWLWSLNRMQKGGILGDDMGLGKTMQCAAFLSGLFTSSLSKRVLVVAPKTLLAHWSKEFAVCGMVSRVYNFYGSSESEREVALRAVCSQHSKSGGILLTTYGMVLHNYKQLCYPYGPNYKALDGSKSSSSKFGWDWIILDEGHKLKNPKMKLAEAMKEIPATGRLIISGTPIQNNLMEMHALFQFCSGDLLGDARYFKRVYEKPITAGQDRTASERARSMGSGVAAELRRITAPYFLRREKKDVLRTIDQGGEAESEGSGQGGAAGVQTISHKNDLVVWLKLSPDQQRIYKAFLNTETVKSALNETKSALSALTVLKKVCDHPALLNKKAAMDIISGGRSRWAPNMAKKGQAGKSKDKKKTTHGYEFDDDFVVDESEESEEEEEEEEEGGQDSEVRDQVEDQSEEWGAWAEGGGLDRQLFEEMERKGSGRAEASCKTMFVLALLKELVASGHKTLIFSQSRVMLDILQSGIKSYLNLSMCRIDGTMEADERHQQVKKFQATGSTIPVFLLTSQVGGLGLTLTAADRVIIVDPNWNPSIDNQSVDRAYRIGQKRDVVVYRLITCGTVEEKIYRKQVFKGGLSRTGTEEGVQFRYFALSDLRDLFTVTEEGLACSQTQSQLHKMHAAQRRESEELTKHLLFLNKQESFAGISDHDLLFSRPSDDVGSTAEEGRRMIHAMQVARTNEPHGSSSGGGGGYGGGSAGSARANNNNNDISSMMQSMLTLGLSTEERRVQQEKKKRAEIEATVIKQTALLASFGPAMPDGGAKMKKKIHEMEQELASPMECHSSERSTDARSAQASASSTHSPVLPPASASYGLANKEASYGLASKEASYGRTSVSSGTTHCTDLTADSPMEHKQHTHPIPPRNLPSPSPTPHHLQSAQLQPTPSPSVHQRRPDDVQPTPTPNQAYGQQEDRLFGSVQPASSVSSHSNRVIPSSLPETPLTPEEQFQPPNSAEPSISRASVAPVEGGGSTGRPRGLNIAFSRRSGQTPQLHGRAPSPGNSQGGALPRAPTHSQSNTVTLDSDDESFVSAHSSVLLSGKSSGVSVGMTKEGGTPSSQPTYRPAARGGDVVDLTED